MPILELEQTVFPENLLTGFVEEQEEDVTEENSRSWWAVFTMARREKSLARQLVAQSVPFYLPLVAKEHRNRGGRRMRSYMPLFTGYVFLYGSAFERVKALTTNHISQTLPVPDQAQLLTDLRQVQQLIELDCPLTIERRLKPGRRVRIKAGPMAGFEGTVTARRQKTRLLIHVHFLQSGVSVEIDDYMVEPVD